MGELTDLWEENDNKAFKVNSWWTELISLAATFSIDSSSVEALRIKVVSQDTVANDRQLCLYNFATESWETISKDKPGTDKKVIEGTKTGDLSNYINNNQIMVAVSSGTPTYSRILHQLSVDFMELNVAYKSN